MTKNNPNTLQFNSQSEISFDDFKNIVINDYKIAYESRQISLLGRREVLTGKAKFGIFGDGKEVAQLAMAKVFNPGDWRAGYYRDQTFMLATGMVTKRQLFAQLYANTDVAMEPSSAGRQMNNHFATRLLDDKGQWKNLSTIKNTSADVSPTASQMQKLVGLAYASKLFRQNKDLHKFTQFSNNGNEVAFGTIGNASTSEGVFFESINAAGVLQIPMAVSVWDDAYGISVPSKYQTTKENISEILKGFQRDEHNEGFEIFRVKGWDYVALCETYEKAIQICRTQQVPVLIHVTELTQPQGHSTSGSHERYKPQHRLAWEKNYDCILKMREWMLQSAIATEEELNILENISKNEVKRIQKEAWADFIEDIQIDKEQALTLLDALALHHEEVKQITLMLRSEVDPLRKELISTVRKAIRISRKTKTIERDNLVQWYSNQQLKNNELYHTCLYTNSVQSPLKAKSIAPVYTENSPMVDGREVLNACFDANFTRDPLVIAFGEDLGAIGDVNQGFAGLQQKYGENRICDTGIREITIVGQAMGLALRGFKPIAEIQYLDYITYAMSVLSDDIATLSYRTKGGQKAPLIIRTRGHRLEGIWHAGSPMGMLVNALKGMHICVPRNMVQAAGMYNTLLQGDEPALLIECLNGYRIKERLPENVGQFKVPLGIAEIIRTGNDITLVSYGSTLRIVNEAANELLKMDIDAEVIDLQTLIPFDLNNDCLKSIKKTNKLLVIDEDVPGGGSAYILQQILENQKAYNFLDAAPQTLTAKEHRTPYGTDGDYFGKPSVDDVIETVYQIIQEYMPQKYP
ncbi:MAG: transketolase [Sphingobacteriales bacterium]|nr:MAG: transketolase [Sphingobacteriales bacterium]TAF82218.1 MAG: transketolase [Sphingobacteriales bacterium]